jgi:hypothetical protein
MRDGSRESLVTDSLVFDRIRSRPRLLHRALCEKFFAMNPLRALTAASLDSPRCFAKNARARGSHPNTTRANKPYFIECFATRTIVRSDLCARLRSCASARVKASSATRA